MKVRKAECKSCGHNWFVKKQDDGIISCPRCQKRYNFDIVKEVEI